jgi:hypothetical protein
MMWKEKHGNEEEGQSAVTPYDVVTQVTAMALRENPDVSGAQIGRENLALFQGLYGENEVSERGLIDQIREAMDETQAIVEAEQVNLMALATAHYGQVFTEDQVNLVTLDNSTRNKNLTAQVGARIFQRKRQPFELAQAGDVILGKKAGKIYGMTRINDIQYTYVEENSVEAFHAAIEDAKATLAEMAEDISAENKDIVLEDGFWMEGSKSIPNGKVSKSGQKLYDQVTVPVEEAHATENDEGETIYSAYITLATFDEWTLLRDVYVGEIPGKGMLWANLNMGQGPGASWFCGVNETVDETVCSFGSATWHVPQKRGRKPSPETVAKREAEAAAAAEEEEETEDEVEVEVEVEEVDEQEEAPNGVDETMEEEGQKVA